MKKFKFQSYATVPITTVIKAVDIKTAEKLLANRRFDVFSQYAEEDNWVVSGKPAIHPISLPPTESNVPNEIEYHVEGAVTIPVFTRIKASSLEEAWRKAIEDIGIVYEPSPVGRVGLEEDNWVIESMDLPVRPLYFTEMTNEKV